MIEINVDGECVGMKDLKAVDEYSLDVALPESFEEEISLSPNLNAEEVSWLNKAVISSTTVDSKFVDGLSEKDWAYLTCSMLHYNAFGETQLSKEEVWSRYTDSIDFEAEETLLVVP